MSLVSLATADLDPLLQYSILRSQPSNPMGSMIPSEDGNFEKLYRQASLAESMDLKVETVKALSEYVFQENLLIPLFERRANIWYRAERVASLGNQDGLIWFYFDRLKTKAEE